MTYRMGLLMPDRFAAAAAYVGPPAYQLWAPPAPPQPTERLPGRGPDQQHHHERAQPAFRDQRHRRGRARPAAGAQAAGADVHRPGPPARLLLLSRRRPLRPDRGRRVGAYAGLPRPLSRSGTSRRSRSPTGATPRWTCPSSATASTAPTGSTAWSCARRPTPARPAPRLPERLRPGRRDDLRLRRQPHRPESTTSGPTRDRRCPRT